MASTKIKFTWANPPIDKTKWRLGVCAVHNRGHDAMPDLKGLSARAQKHFLQRTVHISLRGVMLWMMVLAVLAYVVSAYALFQVQSARPHNRITYADMALPWRWSGLSVLRGQALIDEARDEIKAGKFAVGFSRLRMGLNRNPTDTTARTDLSQVYILRRLRSHSDTILMGAFEHGYPGREYVEQSYRTITYGDNAAKELAFLAAARSALATAGGPADDERVIDALTLETMLRLQRHDEAAKLGRSLYKENSDPRFEVELAIALSAGNMARAVEIADRWRELKPQTETVLARAAGVYRRAGRHDDMQACLDQLRKISPTNPAHATFSVVQNLLAGREKNARAALEDGLFRFGSNPRELAVWAKDIAETGRDDFLATIEKFMSEHGHDLRPILFARLLAQIRSRDWNAAPATVARIQEREGRMGPAELMQVKVMTTLAMACVDAGGGTQQVFTNTYQRSPTSLDFSRMMLEALLDANRVKTAGQLITFVEGVYPESDYLKEVAGRVKGRLGVLADQKEKDRPVSTVSPAERFTDAAALLTELKRLGEDGRADDGLTLIRAVVKAPPPWLAGHEEALALQELELAFRSNDLTMLQFTVRNYLRGFTDKKQQALIKVATGWHQAGRKVESLLAVREILKIRPDHEAALKALDAWDPKPLPVADKIPALPTSR